MTSEELNNFGTEISNLKDLSKDQGLSKCCRERIKRDLVELKKEIDSLIFDIELENF